MQSQANFVADDPAGMTHRPTIAVIWTREIDDQPMAGRLHVARSIREALTAAADLRPWSMAAGVRGPGFYGSLLALARSLLRLRPLPLQCALFASEMEVSKAVAAVPPDADAVYLDGIRCVAVLERLRRERPDLRIVVDMDDLMSRRMQLLLEAGQPLSPGYLSRRLPGLVNRLAGNARLGRWIVRYERAALKVAERRVLELADDVVLLSSADAAALEAFGDRFPGARSRVTAIPPAVDIHAAPEPLKPPLRFVFIGADALTQNRLTIDYLLKLWKDYAITTPLVIYGAQTRGLPYPPCVSAPGYVERMEEVYDGSSILLTPSFLAGGIKTKVLEAFAYGAPVVANTTTFESMAIGDYPFKIDDEAALVELLRAPEAHIDALHRAAVAGAAYVAHEHAPDTFARRWCNMMVQPELSSAPARAAHPATQAPSPVLPASALAAVAVVLLALMKFGVGIVLIAVSLLLLGLAAHPFVTYPQSLRLFPRRKLRAGLDTRVRTVALCMSAYNEERVIREKAENLLAMARAYGPAEIYIYVDGAADRTAELLEEYRDRIHVVVSEERRGKTLGLETLIRMSNSELLAFTDANVMGPEDGLVRLAAPFADPTIGLAGATLVYTNPNESPTAQSGAAYWGLEEGIKAEESETIGVMGVDGAFFMIRREAYAPPPPDLIDDLYVSLMVLIKGWHVVSSRDVVVNERSATAGLEEFRRKARISCQALNVHKRLWPQLARLPKPLLYGYLSHRLVKWFVPFLLLGSALFGMAGLIVLFGLPAVQLIGLTLVVFVVANLARVSLAQRITAYGLALAGVGKGVLESLFGGKTYITWNPATSVRG